MHTLLGSHAGQGAGEQSGLDGGDAALEDTGQMALAAAERRHLRRREHIERLQTVPGEHIQGALPGTDLAAVAGSPEPAVLTEVRAQAVAIAERPDGPHRVLGRAQKTHALLAPADFQQRGRLRHPGHGETAVAAARAGPAQIRFDDGDVDGSVATLDLERRPKPGESAADDTDIGAQIVIQGNRRRRLGVERLLEPETPHSPARPA